MRWTLVTETYPPEVNGVAMTLQRLVTTLAAQGHEVSVVRPRQKVDKMRRPRGEDGKVYFDANGTQTDFVLGLPMPGYRGMLLGRMAKHKLVRLWRRQKPDVIHIATEGPLGLSALMAARKLGLPVVTTFHTNFHSYGEHYGAGLLKRPLIAYLRWFHNRSLATFAPASDVVEQLEQAGLERLYLMGRGVDTRLFGRHRRSVALRQSWGVEQDAKPTSAPVVLYVGRVAAEKNLPLAIEAFERLRARLSQARMVVVGDGPLRERLQEEYPHIHFAGMRYGEDLAAHYASADLFFFASVTETFGNVITEAMASSLVVLSYDYAAAARYIKDGTSGFTAAFDDSQALFAAVNRMVDRREQWGCVGAAAAQAVADLSWDSIASGYMRRTEHIVAEYRARHGRQPATV